MDVVYIVGALAAFAWLMFSLGREIHFGSAVVLTVIWPLVLALILAHRTVQAVTHDGYVGRHRAGAHRHRRGVVRRQRLQMRTA